MCLWSSLKKGDTELPSAKNACLPAMCQGADRQHRVLFSLQHCRLRQEEGQPSALGLQWLRLPTYPDVDNAGALGRGNTSETPINFILRSKVVRVQFLL